MAGILANRLLALRRGSRRAGFGPNRVMGEYRIVEPLGADERGIVYVAEHVEHRTRVMLRALDAASALKTRIDCLFNDARLIRTVRHPAIAQVLDLGYADDGQPFIVTELLGRETLADRLLGGRQLSLVQALTIARGIASALTAAHARGVIHRALEPRSVVLVGGGEQVKVVDFGLARLDFDQVARPNQRSDLHSLGCILFEMFEGRPPRIDDHERTELAAPAGVRALVASLLVSHPRRRSGGIDVRSAGLVAIAIDRVVAEIADREHVAIPVDSTWKIRFGLTSNWMMMLGALLFVSAVLAALFATCWYLAR